MTSSDDARPTENISIAVLPPVTFLKSLDIALPHPNHLPPGGRQPRVPFHAFLVIIVATPPFL
jgi:hypothetical protein